MELTTPIPQSSAGDRRRGFSFLRSSTMALCLSIAALGTSSAMVDASTPPQIPLFAEVPSTANNTLAHELGHNMGDAHDRATGGTGVYPYSYGYRDEVGKFRTIMAYGCPTVSCPRVKYFSNPRLLYNGRPLGIDHATNPANSADNARSMNDVRHIVAAWRAATTDMTPPAAPSGIQVR